jgi:hypothetical protein
MSYDNRSQDRVNDAPPAIEGEHRGWSWIRRGILHRFFMGPAHDHHTREEVCRYQVYRSKRITKEFKMTTGHSTEMGTNGALAQKVTAWSRPLLAGALAAGVIALGASSAVAASPVGSPVSGPSTAWSHSTNASMMSGTSMGIMLGTTAPMMTICTEMGTMPHASPTMMSRTGTTMTSHTSSATRTRMMSGTSTATPPDTSTGTGTGTGMMSSTSTATPPTTSTGTGTGMMG